MTWRRDKLPELVRAMSGRPRHEALRGHVTELLREGFGAPYDELYLLDNRGRIDTMWGATVIELKSDLRRELSDVQARMPDYLADAARRTLSPRPVTGIATDGATFIGYQLIEGVLTELRRYETDPEHPNELMAWLEPLLSEHVGLAPEARAVAQAFGKGSLTFSRARLTLDALWADLNGDPNSYCSSGGNLGNGRTHITMYNDSIEQLRGTVGARQVGFGQRPRWGRSPRGAAAAGSCLGNTRADGL
jgi:hypothetical protein